jgi:hypothetical protein
MKNQFVTILILLLSSVSAQDSKFSFGVNLFPNLSVPFYVSNSSAPVDNDVFGGVIDNKYSFSSNVFTEFKATEKFIVSLGVGYFNNGETVPVEQLTFGVPDPSQPTSARFYSNHHSLEVPLLLKYYFSKRFYGILGISGTYNFSNTTSAKFTFNDGRSETSDPASIEGPYRVINTYANIGLGFDYIVKDNYALYIQPYTQYGFLGLAKDVPLNIIPFSFGFSVGARFNK